MARKPTPTEFDNNFPVAGWSRNTVADGNWLNNNTIDPLKKRDTELLNLINDNSTESEEADMNLAEGLNNLKEEIEKTFELSAGNNITLVEDPTGRILTIHAADTPVDNFVTSARDVISQDGLAYFLIKDGESSKWDGIDLSTLGKQYNVVSDNEELLKVTTAVNNNDTTYTLSAKDWSEELAEKVDKDEFDEVVDQIEDTFVDLSATVDRDYVKKGEIPEPVFYDISASYANAYSGTYGDKDYYFIEGAKIKGKDGLAAEYDENKNEWEIGLDTTGLSYLYDNYTNNGTAVSAGDVIKFSTSHSQDIDIDSDGNIEIPEMVDKFTININEFIEDNTPNVHNFLLNKLSLYSGNSKIISTQNYYNAEVGSSNATIALTIDNTSNPTHTYTLKYEGSDIAATAQLNITISILEEVTCLAEVNGGGGDYEGNNPINVDNNDRAISLSYDNNIFALNANNELSLKNGQGNAIDPEEYAALVHSIESRMTETFPIAMTSLEATHAAGQLEAYLFRPTIEYDCTTATSAFIYAGNVDNGTQMQVAIYDASNPSNMDLMWRSDLCDLDSSHQGQRVLSANPNDTYLIENKHTIYPNGIYYMAVHIVNHQVNNAICASAIAGISVNSTTDIGNPKPWLANSTFPYQNNTWPLTADSSQWGSMANMSYKMYIGLKND